MQDIFQDSKSILLPPSKTLPIDKLAGAFRKTVATYKFFWFRAILDEVLTTGNTTIDGDKLLMRMVSLAWNAVSVFRLSFGYSDSLPQIISAVRKTSSLGDNEKSNRVLKFLQYADDTYLTSIKLSILRNEVPYRFLSPWIGVTTRNSEAMQRAKNFTGLCPYRFYEKAKTWGIEVHPLWAKYFVKNYAILQDFCFWNLARFLQSKNPSVPGICEKISPTFKKSPLSTQKKLWDTVVEARPDLRCIYSGEFLRDIPNRDLDHFIPWSFVVHNQLWNLMPVDSVRNRQKQDRIPDVTRYIKDLAHNEKIFVTFYKTREYKAQSPLTDFSTFGKSLRELAAMSESDFCEMLANTLQPLEKIALASGFERWN